MQLKQAIREKPFLFALFIFALNLVLKSLFLTEDEIGLDEPFTIYHAQFPPSVIIDHLKGYNNPPLFELLLHFWIKLFGISPLAVRTFPLIWACLCPVALFYFGRKHFSLRAGVVSSLLLSFSNLLIFYSHDCRVYGLFLLLSIASMHFYLGLPALARPNKRIIVLYILSSALLIYAHYFGIFVLFFQAIHALVFRRKELLRFGICVVTILILYVPHIFVMLSRMKHNVSKGTWLGPPSGFESLYNMLWSFSNFPLITVCIIVLMVSAFVKLF